ncbi:MAG: Eco57I restriction-modification methylase domain-containing protein [Oscillospiraceae bacterium]|nr:Eco57I restriction-modification methylase domain-containing protein [Oscillospiraceae bacterium]
MKTKIQEIITTILRKTEIYKTGQSKESRKQKGQFFSSLAIAQFMANQLAAPELTEVSILDPGAGNGLLGFMALAKCLEWKTAKSISLTYIENDPEVLPILQWLKIEVENCLSTTEVKIQVHILQDNFILKSFADKRFDILISNPPFVKIARKSAEAAAMSEYVFGQPNMYALFSLKGLSLLKSDAQFVLITPRSWTSGNYFVRMREYVAENVSIEKIHLFDSRDRVFSDEDVLQETMIWTGRIAEQKRSITVSISKNDQFADVTTFSGNSSMLLSDNPDKNIFLPSSYQDYCLLAKMREQKNTFDSLGYIFKTGPVVEFRCKNALSKQKRDNYIPMLRPSNIQKGGFCFPLDIGKAQYVDVQNNPAFVIPNTPTVLVRRLSAKEEPRRLQCCAYRPIPDENNISVENHVNYLIRKDGKPISEEEMYWACNLLTSDQYECYFRMLSGSTQVNARELNMLPVEGRL